MRVADDKRINLLGTRFINCGHLDLRINQHRTPGRKKNLFKPTRNRYEYDEYVKKLLNIIQENCHLIYVK